MATAKRADNLALMQMALAGYEVEKQRIEEKIREINSLLGGKRIKPGATSGATSGAAKTVVNRGPGPLSDT